MWQVGILQFKNESYFSMSLEGFVQLKQIRMSKVVSNFDLTANHCPLNSRARDELGSPVSTCRSLNSPVYHAKRAPVHTSPSFVFIHTQYISALWHCLRWTRPLYLIVTIRASHSQVTYVGIYTVSLKISPLLFLPNVAICSAVFGYSHSMSSVCLSVICRWPECIVTRWLKLGSRGFTQK